MTLSALVFVALIGAGCATFRCAPTSITVAEREQRSRLREIVRGVRTDAVGRVYEDRRMEFVPEYWVRSTEGQWYDVGRDAYRVAIPGRLIDVCR